MTWTTEVRMKSVECCNCHAVFAMSAEMYEKRQKDHKNFYCPAGHGQHFTAKSEEEKLREKLAKEQHCCEQNRAEVKRTKAALPYPLSAAVERAKRWAGDKARRGAFWKGFNAAQNGASEEDCPYETNRGGFRHVWMAGHGIGS